jgi:hypothetical protein
VFDSSKIGVLDSLTAKTLAVCPYIKKVSFSRGSSPYVHHFWNMCSLTRKHCSSHGKRYKFKPCFGGCRVAWVCPELVGLPALDS